jgi:polysaccharide export outer membrane protein
MSFKKGWFGCFFTLILLTNIISCTSTKKIKYFQDIPDSGRLADIKGAMFSEPKIQPGDILTILVQTIDPTASAPINTGNVVSVYNAVTPGVGSFNQQPIAGYLIDNDGTTTLPILGNLKLGGLTITEAKKLIAGQANKYFKNTPTVIVRFANFRVNVTGEVTKPGMYVLATEKVSLMDALAVAGDLTIFAKRENVLLIREGADGNKIPYRFNMKKSDIMSSPYFYLRQNDLIYVEPNQSKAAANDASQVRTYTIIGSLLSVLIVFLTRK